MERLDQFVIIDPDLAILIFKQDLRGKYAKFRK